MAAKKYHQNHNVNEVTDLIKPATNAFVITPHNDNELTYFTRALLIKGTGNINVVMADGTDPIALPVFDGQWNYSIKKVLVTDTTAGLTIIGLV